MVRFTPAAIAAIVGLLGCGPAAVSRDEYLSRGNAICRATATRIAQLAAPGPGSTAPPEKVAGYVDAYVAELRQELADLRLIGYPRGERRTLERAYAVIDRGLTAAERDPLSFRGAALTAAAAPLRDQGLTACRS